MLPRHVYILRGILPLLLLHRAAPVYSQTGPRTVKVDCAEVLQKMRADIARDPSRLLLAFEDALTTSEVCACPIIRTAMDFAGRDPALTIEILVAAIHHLPASAALITECVLLEAPDALPRIRAALAKELGEKSPELLLSPSGAPPLPGPSGDEKGRSDSGKQPAALAPAVSGVPDFFTAPGDGVFFPTVGASGIYITLSGRTTAPQRGSVTAISGHGRGIITTKTSSTRPVLSVTRTNPD